MTKSRSVHATKIHRRGGEKKRSETFGVLPTTAKRRRRKVSAFLIWKMAGSIAAVLLVLMISYLAVPFSKNVENVADDVLPELKLNGASELAVVKGKKFHDLGAIASDDSGFVILERDGGVDTGTVGDYEIDYTAIDSAGNVATAKRKVKVVEARGTVYLTFDDGPGPYTAQLLDVLRKYNVKATFFVTGAGDDALIRREFEEGHAVGLHTLSHNYAYIYQNMDTFFADLVAVQDRVKRITGETSYLMRFPGGSSNLVSQLYDGGAHIMSRLVTEVERQGYAYFDWNASSGDADGASTTDEVYDNVIHGLMDGGETVVLQHDIKDFSVDAVERIIQYGLANGYVFEKLDKDSFGAHHGVNN